MKRLVALIILFSCAREPERPEVREWLAVLERKTVALSAASDSERVAARQAYADALVAFVGRHPIHHRARKAYEELSLEYARELVARGEYDRAIDVYENVISRNPAQEEARAELMETRDRRSVTPAEIEQVRSGMSPDEVRAILGEPPPEWIEKRASDRLADESWYYRRADGKASLVFFVNGKVAKVEY